MDGTDRARHEPRRFVTRHDVEDAHAAGRTIRLRGRDVLTHEAAHRATALGVRVERDTDRVPAAAASPVPAAPSAPSAPASVSTDALRHAVRVAVVAELGTEPPNLDAVIDRVLRARA